MTEQSAREKLLPLRMMMMIRAFETALSKRHDHGFQLLSTGEEAVAVGLCAALREDDQLLTGGRSIGPALARGLDPCRVMAELLGRIDGINKGRAGRGHMAQPSSGFFGAHAVVGGNISIAAGVALSRQISGSGGLVAVLFGDGACGAGVLHETLNFAAIWKLPLLFVCNNNRLSVSTKREDALAPALLSDFARAFGMPSCTVDGMDVTAVLEAAQDATTHIRTVGGPAFIECLSFRFGRHSTTARETRSRAEIATIQAACPIVREMAVLSEHGLLSSETAVALEAEINKCVVDAMAFADASPMPDPASVLYDV